jgi:hypothetical protein
MFHPLEGDLSQFKDSEIEEKLLDLNKKYSLAARLGNQELLTQIQTFVTIYREEMSTRYRQAKDLINDETDLNDLINVD